MANDININESVILETLNAKIDYDGGNYKGSGLANYVVDKSGDTMTGALRCDVKGQWQSPIHFISSEMDWTAGANRSTNIGIHYYDKNDKVGPYFLLSQAEGSTNNYFSMGNDATNNPKFLGFDFPKATSKATTTSTATRYKPAVIVQNYRNGNTWYRVWSDGWIEQGGRISMPYATNTVTFAKAFSTTAYYFGAPIDAKDFVYAKDKVTFLSAWGTGYAYGNVSWYACGY